MKILTKEEEQEHYNATLKGGITGGTIGLLVGGGAVYAASARFATIRHLTLPMKTFLTTSSATFAAIISADRSSRSFEWNRDPSRQYRDQSQLALDSLKSAESPTQRLKEWGRANRYPIVTASWVASIAVSLALVGRNPYLSRAQKLVQARVYAQGLTLAVLIATAALEVGDANKGRGRWETVKILDPDDPEHKHIIEKRIHHESYSGEDLWRDMVATEERKIAAREKAAHSSSSSSQTPSNPQPKGKEAKDAILKDSKSAGKDIDYRKAEALEAKNMQRQTETESAARGENGHAGAVVGDGVVVSDRG